MPTPEPIKVALLSLACGLTLSCEADQEAADDTLTHRYKEHQERLTDSDSPLGYWEIDHRYPVFKSETHPGKAEEINAKITEQLEQYQCPDKGDQAFSAKVESQADGELMVTYEAMWLCSSMPAPDSTEGELIFELP